MVEIISGGNMLDQNTTTVLTTLITVLGTLGGVVLGVVLSNRYVAKHEKAKRNAEIIEEVYALLIKISARYENNIKHKNPSMRDIEPDLHRLEILIYLYLPSMKHKHRMFIEEMIQFGGKSYYLQQSKSPHDAKEELEGLSNHFNEKLVELKEELEKLAK
jgi:hypothetical protein